MSSKLLFGIGALALAAGSSLSVAAGDAVGYWRFESEGARFTLNEGKESLRLVGAGVGGGSPSALGGGRDSAGPLDWLSPLPRTGVINHGAAVFQADRFQVFRVIGAEPPAQLLGESFTVEALVRLDSIPQRTYSTLMTHGGGWEGNMAWQLIVTGADSTHGPGQLLFQFSTDGSLQDGLTTLKSGIQLEQGRSYYVAFAFDARESSPEGAVFHVASAHDGWRLRTHPVARRARGLFASAVPLSIGAGLRERGAGYNCWDGVIDEVRFSRGQLPVGDLLITPR